MRVVGGGAQASHCSSTTCPGRFSPLNGLPGNHLTINRADLPSHFTDPLRAAAVAEFWNTV